MAYCTFSKYLVPSFIVATRQKRSDDSLADTLKELFNDLSEFFTSDNFPNAKPVPLPLLTAHELARLGIDVNVNKDSRKQFFGGAALRSVNVDMAPHNTMGKLFFRHYDGTAFECSGQYIDEYIVMTAAHCVYDVDTSTWHRNFLFIQQYRGNHGRRYSGFPRRVKHAIAHKGWASRGSENYAYDIAFLAMVEPTVTTWLTVGYPENFYKLASYGYPSNFYGGQLLMRYDGEKGDLSQTVVEMPFNPMGQGCSGGAWIASDAEKHYAVGVNSFNYEGRVSIFSPRFAKRNIDVIWKRAKVLSKQSSRIV